VPANVVKGKGPLVYADYDEDCNFKSDVPFDRLFVLLPPNRSFPLYKGLQLIKGWFNVSSQAGLPAKIE